MASRLLAMLIPVFAVVTLPLGILTGIFVGLPAALAVFVVGWLLLTPLSALIYGFLTGASTGAAMGDNLGEHIEKSIEEELSEEFDTGSSTDPVEELRDRYARGEIDELELERRLDAILETEDVTQKDAESIERAMDNLDTDRVASSDSHSEELVTDRE